MLDQVEEVFAGHGALSDGCGGCTALVIDT